MKKYVYTKEIDIPIYSGRFRVVVSNDYDLLDEECDYFGDDKHGLEYYDTNEDGIVRFNVLFYINENFTNGTIAHECLHATFDLLNRVKIEYVADNECNGNESYTYLLGFFVNEVYKVLKDNNVKIK
jgi:hypothetical protein